MNAARARVSVFAVLGLMWVLVACADDDGAGASAEPETTETTSAEEARAELEAELVAVYESAWTEFVRAADPPDPDTTALADYTTGAQLTRGRSVLGEYAAEGVVLRGTYEFDAAVTEVGDDTAIIEDCGLSQLEEIFEATGEVVGPFDDQRDGIVADLVLEDGTWKVSNMRSDDEVCA